MKKNVILIIGSIFLVLLLSWTVAAQEEPEVNSADEELANGDNKEVVLEQADSIRYDAQNEVFIAQGGVVAIEGKSRIECEKLEFNLKENTGVFQEKVVVRRDKTEINSQIMRGDFDQDLYFFEGEVILRKEREEEDGTSTIVWLAPSLTFEADTEKAWSEGGVEIAWKDTSIQAQKAFYYPEDEESGEPEKIVLAGKTLISEADREIEAEGATYYLDSEVLEAEKVIRATFQIEKK